MNGMAASDKIFRILDLPEPKAGEKPEETSRRDWAWLVAEVDGLKSQVQRQSVETEELNSQIKALTEGDGSGGSISLAELSRRIAKIEVTHKLSGNQFFGFVPNARFVRPLVGMAVNTTAITRLNPTDNYQFLIMGAMGLEIRGDYNSKSGVFYSVVQN